MLFLIFVTLCSRFKLDLVSVLYGAGEKVVSTPKEYQGAVSLRRENGMLQRQNNGDPVCIHIIIIYLLEATLCTKHYSRSWEFKDQSIGPVLKKLSVFQTGLFVQCTMGAPE